jgi:hypothetical protein
MKNLFLADEVLPKYHFRMSTFISNSDPFNATEVPDARSDVPSSLWQLQPILLHVV